ncbi:MAG: glycoside hydrolase family 15 protein, partial [Anaerolineales bacterium]
FLAAGAHTEARRILNYLQSTQDVDGHWSQNMWLDGSPYWSGIQMDESAFPILLFDLAWREKVIQEDELDRYWPMVRQAASYLVGNGPVTDQDRWEEDAGYAPFTLAVEIAALLAAADLAENRADSETAQLLRETADAWNADIERWTFITGTDLARKVGVAGYYVRIAPPNVGESGTLSGGYVPIKNRSPGESSEPASRIVSPDALAFVRFGLRAADDPRITDTLKVIDDVLKCDTPFGPAWYRYNDDGYGEHADGSAYDGTGVGRPWPLLVGERAHYELAAGHQEKAASLLQTMQAFANQGGMLPEQIWDSEDIPARELFMGQPSGSAMPLVWAHAEYIKLCRSLRDGRVFDMPPQPVQRYQQNENVAQYALWKFSHKRRSIPSNVDLRIGLKFPAVILWWVNDQSQARRINAKKTSLDFFIADLPTRQLPSGTNIKFIISSPEIAVDTPGHFQVTIAD